MADNDNLPNKTFNVKFCDKCGANDYFRGLSARHFSKGSICKGGKLKIVTYRRDDSTIREAQP